MAGVDSSSSKPPSDREDALAVLKRLRDAGHIAYFAGGCVRDLLLGLPAKDYDVATDAPPDRVRSLFPNTQAVGAAFGVILVRQRKSMIEVATFRTDGDYSDGRRPDSVRFTTAEEDARRRDFTINGLFLDPIENKVIDYVGGQADLAARVIRAIGDPAARFKEDHLRLLRAIRFAARLGFTIAPKTADAIQHGTGSLKTISPERIADELRRMLTPATRDQAFVLLRQFGLLNEILRFLIDPPAHRPDETFSIFLALGRPLHDGSISFGLALAAVAFCQRLHATATYDRPLSLLSHEEIRRACRAVRQALKISNEEQDDMAGSLSFASLLQGQPSVAMMKRFLALPTSDNARLLMAAIASCGLMRETIDPMLATLAELAKQDVAPPPFVTGDDLVAAGLSPGRHFKIVLDAVYDAQLESRISDRDEALKFALQLAQTK